MTLGTDKQFDLSWAEQDKIRRRLEIKNRLKAEGIDVRYSPLRHLKGEHFVDPATERYMDLRKKGRMPGAPFKPSMFFGIWGMIFIPFGIIWYCMEAERQPWLAKIASGELPVSEREGRRFI